MVQSVLCGIAALIILTLTALAARKGATAFQGVLFGIVAGICAATGLGFADAFLGYVIPIGQLEFWLASWFAHS